MGDLVVGDGDGIVIVPQALVGEALTRVGAKFQLEQDVRGALAGGASTHDVYERFGIL
jgi:regulator of RNase E activity RraA